VIEWHIFSEKLADTVKRGALRVDIDEGPRENEVLISAPALMAYSKEIDKVDKDCIPWFKKNSPISAITVESWPEWKQKVVALAPKILVLLVHTEQEGIFTLLEVGPPDTFKEKKEYRLAIDYLSSEYIHRRDVTSPIVLLLGCTTNQAKFEFNSVASVFEYYGAKVLVATNNLIYGPKAVKLAQMLLAKLHDLDDGENFGEVMLAVRRQALADGNPMVLCLSSYGDADWKLRKGEVDVRN
jgi:hypothetical protein